MMIDKPLPWSYSAWSAYQKCPRQYYEVRVAKSVSGESFLSKSGDNQHEAFEKAVKKKQPLPPSMAHHQPMLDQIMQLPGQKFAEQQLAINAQLQPVDYWAKDVWLRAKVDLTVEEPKRSTIIDWKTGKSRYADTNQLKLTSLVVFAHRPQINEVRSALLFTTENVAIQATYHREKAVEYWGHLLPIYGDMVRSHESGHFVAKKSGLCKVCPVKTCEFNRNV